MQNVTVSALSLSVILLAQSLPAQTPNPLYRVTIVSRTTKAVNYGHRTTPTRIDFTGTPLAPTANGEAVVESKSGATLVRAKFDEVPRASQFGPQYLTYVVWAISPDGRAQNMGELTLDGDYEGKLTASTSFQTFAMIVTAEPYYSVTQPSDVVVMENVIGPGTVGKVEEVNASYELLPRSGYTYDPRPAAAQSGKLVSQEEYEATSAIYQAQNALQIAESQNAQRHAPAQLARARQLIQQASSYPMSLSNEIIAVARQATQLAEDARMIAMKRAEGERLAAEAKQAAPSTIVESAAPVTAATESVRARAQETAVAATQPAPAQPPITVDSSQFRDGPQAMENRRRLLASLQKIAKTRDTPAGIVVTIPESIAAGDAMPPHAVLIAAAISPYKDLHIDVQGHSDSSTELAGTQRRAENVRQALVAAGVAPTIVTAKGYGDTRLITSNATASGRAENRRIEIVIMGDAIGTLATWDRTYPITRTR